MSGWEDYISELTSENQLSHAAILDNDQFDLCGSTTNFELKCFDKLVEYDNKTYKVDEKSIIKEIFSKSGIVSNPPGIYLNGEKFVLVSYDSETNVCFLSKKNGGACLAMTNKCIIIGVYDKEKNPNQTVGDCNNTVIKFAENFIENDY